MIKEDSMTKAEELDKLYDYGLRLIDMAEQEFSALVKINQQLRSDIENIGEKVTKEVVAYQKNIVEIASELKHAAERE